MKKRVLFLLMVLLTITYAQAADYYTASPSATISGNAASSANWTTNPDGITGLGNITISATDNLFILTGAKVTLSAATTVNNVDVQGGTATTLTLGTFKLTVTGNLTGSCIRTGVPGIEMTGANKLLNFTEVAGSSMPTTDWLGNINNGGGLRILSTVTLTGNTTLYGVLVISAPGKLILNDNTFTASLINVEANAYFTGSTASAVIIAPKVAASNTSNLYFDQSNPGVTNVLNKLQYANFNTSRSAFVSLKTSLIVNALTAGVNSTTGCLSVDNANTTLTINGDYTTLALTGIKARVTNTAIAFGPASSITFASATARPLQDSSKLILNGGTLKLNGVSSSGVYTLIKGNTITGTFNNLQLSCGSCRGTISYPSNTVVVTVDNSKLVYYSDSFDSTALNNYWSATKSRMSLSTEHFKKGTQSLKWEVDSAGAELTASGLGIPSNVTVAWDSSACRFYIYNKTASNDTLLVRFYDSTGVLKREGRMLLNFTGWQDYFRSHYHDYAAGTDLPGYQLDKFKLVYRPQGPSASTTIYLDEIIYANVPGRRTIGPHMLPDTSVLYGSYNLNSEPLKVWLQTPDIPVTTATAQEKTDWQTVKGRFNRTLSMPNSTDLTAAKTFVTNLGITRNADNTIKGTSSITFPIPSSVLLDYSLKIGILARASRLGNDVDAGAKCKAFIEYLLDQGISEGADIVYANSDYTFQQQFSNGLMDALPLLDSTMRNKVVKMIKWSYMYGNLYGSSFTPGFDIDYMFVRSKTLYNICFADSCTDENVRDLKMLTRFLNRFTVPSKGTRDGFKVDGLGFHHNRHYNNYMYTISEWINNADKMKGTVYKIDKSAYDTMSTVVKTLFLDGSIGAVFHNNASSGRHPFYGTMELGQGNLNTLISVGADIIGAPVENNLAATYNYFFPNTTNYPGVTPANYDYYHQFNYGQLGVLRNKRWVATMRGFTNFLWGTEIYAADNRFGRYQSYGALEFLYGTTLRETGYLKYGDGWDWNVTPGATTVHLPWDKLRPNNDYADEYQQKSFAGALALGNNGIWAMELEQKNVNYTPGDLKFKKSVFTFDSIFVCLGTGITTTNTYGITATNLFQAVDTIALNPIYLNSTTPQSVNYDGDLSTATSNVWLVNNVGTGYYIPQGNGNVHVFRGTQSTPQEKDASPVITKLITANVSKAWINHGVAPSTPQQYQFVAVPGITADQMSALSGQFAADSIYIVEKQTDVLHAVKYIPQNITGYAFFSGASNVNIGYVKGISGPALVGIKKEGSSIVINIDNPDLNTTPDKVSTFVTNPYHVNLIINGKWRVLDNPAGAGVVPQSDSTVISFTLQDGFSKSIRLDTADIVQQPVNPTPADSTASVAYGSIPLAWKGKAPHYNLYFGEDTSQLPLKASGLTDSTYTLQNITGLKQYFWRVDAIGADTVISSAVWSFTVTDTIKPNVITKNITVALDTNGLRSVMPADIDSGSTDDYGIKELKLNKTDFGCATVGNNTVVLTVTDNNGNISIGEATVTVLDTVKPAITAPADARFCYDRSNTYTLTALTATDNCGVQSIAYVISGATSRAGSGGDASGLFYEGESIIVWTVTDVNGNVSNAQTKVTVDPKNGGKGSVNFNLKVVPNPTKNHFQVYIQSTKINDRISINVMDLYRRILDSWTNLPPNQTLTFGDRYPSGTYIIEVIQGQERIVKLLIKL